MESENWGDMNISCVCVCYTNVRVSTFKCRCSVHSEFIFVDMKFYILKQSGVT